jgi:hypothetical protein
MSASNPSEEAALIAHHLRALSEHFDSVQIFATRHESGAKDGTLHWQQGAGNWYARFGQVQEWLGVQQARARRDALRADREREQGGEA